jgi:uncharacterized protein (DUF983 family)
MADDAHSSKPQPPSLVVGGLRGCCPRCGKGKLFAGFLALAPRCEHCGLVFSFADSADGPAFFVMFISGFIVAGGRNRLCAALLGARGAVGPLILITTLLRLWPHEGPAHRVADHHKVAEGPFSGNDTL